MVHAREEPLALVSPMERGAASDEENHSHAASSAGSQGSAGSGNGNGSGSGSEYTGGEEGSSSYVSSSYDATESEPRTKDSWDTDISTYPSTPIHQTGCFKCLMWTLAILLVPALIVGILIYKRVIWFHMPTVQYEKGGSSFKLSTQEGGQMATDFNLAIAVKVDNPNTYALKFSDVALQLTDFQDHYVGTAMHEEMITIPAKKSKVFELQAEIHTTEGEVMDIGRDCSVNGLTTQIKAKGSLRAQIIPNFISVPIPMGPYTTMMGCQVTQKGKDDAAPPAAAQEEVAVVPAPPAPEAAAPVEQQPQLDVVTPAPDAPPAGGEQVPPAPQMDAAPATDAAAAPAAPAQVEIPAQ